MKRDGELFKKRKNLKKNFGGFEKVATFAAPFEKTREAKKKIIEKTERLSTRKYNQVPRKQ